MIIIQLINAGGNLYHSRGSTPGSADNVICVGSIDNKVSGQIQIKL